MDSLEDASVRAGPISAETQKIVDDAGPDDFIAKVYAENVPPKTDEDDGKEDDDDDDNGNDGRDDEERKSPYGRNSPEEDDDKVQNAVKENVDQKSEKNQNSKLFLTREESREGTIDNVEGDNDDVSEENGDHQEIK